MVIPICDNVKTIQFGIVATELMHLKTISEKSRSFKIFVII